MVHLQNLFNLFIKKSTLDVARHYSELAWNVLGSLKHETNIILKVVSFFSVKKAWNIVCFYYWVSSSGAK